MSEKQSVPFAPNGVFTGWIDWHGGNRCPIDGRMNVDVRLRDGRTLHGLAKAFSWRHSEIDEMAHGDILSYRKSVSETREPVVAESATTAAAEYARKNPLGGPAKVFEAMASRIRAGEDYHAVLHDFGLCEAHYKLAATMQRENQEHAESAVATLSAENASKDSRIELLEHDMKSGDYETLYAQAIAEIAALKHDIERAVAENTRLLNENLAAEDAMKDALSGWRYIRSSYGDLYGVGWDRVEEKLTAAIKGAKP